MVNNNVEFVSYDGKYPNLCRGELVVSINGNNINLGKCLTSVWGCYFDNESYGYISNGDWKVSVPNEYKEFKEEIVEVVNNNVPHGCCGGCL